MGKSRFHCLCFPFLRLTSSFRRCPLSKRSLLIATACVVYLVFAVSHVGYPQQHRDRRTDKDKYRHTRGLYNIETNGAHPHSEDSETGASLVVPTRSNVVYITLKSKRLKPANIRGTVRPKLRKKVRRNKTSNSAFTQNKFSTWERGAGQIEPNFAPKASWRETRDVDYTSLDTIQKPPKDFAAESHSSSIRIYSQRAPPWFSPQDVGAMRFLADARVLRIREVSHGDSPSLLIFEGETGVSPTRRNHTKRSNACAGQCGVINSPVDTAEVFAFHLDRVLGLNRTLPAVSRKFRFLHGRSPVTRMVMGYLFKT